MNGFVDSGNFCHYNEIPVVFINNMFYEYFKIDKHNIINSIEVKTVSGMEIKNIYNPDKVIIKIRRRECEKKVYVAFSGINEDCLLNPGVLI